MYLSIFEYILCTWVKRRTVKTRHRCVAIIVTALLSRKKTNEWYTCRACRTCFLKSTNHPLSVHSISNNNVIESNTCTSVEPIPSQTPWNFALNSSSFMSAGFMSNSSFNNCVFNFGKNWKSDNDNCKFLEFGTVDLSSF